MKTDVATFWAEFEKEIGEKILSKTMCQHFNSQKSQGEWGLLVLTASSIRFRSTPGGNWFQSLFRMTPPKVHEEPIADIILSKDSIDTIELPKKRLLDFLFSPPFTTLTVSYTVENETHTMVLGIDPKSELFERLLAELPHAKHP